MYEAQIPITVLANVSSFTPDYNKQTLEEGTINTVYSCTFNSHRKKDDGRTLNTELRSDPKAKHVFLPRMAH